MDLDQQMMDTIHRLANKVAEDATTALRSAKLDADVLVKRTDKGFELVLRSKLGSKAHKQAEDIAEAVLESALIRVSSDQKHH